MTRRNTILIAIIVVAVAVLSVVTFAYWDQIATLIGVPREEINTGWIELRNGTTTTGETYTVTQNPDLPGENYGPNAPNPPFNPALTSRWDCGLEGPPGEQCSMHDQVGPVVLDLSSGYPGGAWPEGEYDLTMMLGYFSSADTQSEPLVIEALDPSGIPVASKRIEDVKAGEGECVNDNSIFEPISRTCSNNIGGEPLTIYIPENGKLRFTGPGGSIQIAGVQVSGTPTQEVSWGIVKTTIWGTQTDKVDPSKWDVPGEELDSVALFKVDLTYTGNPTEITFADIYGWESGGLGDPVEYDQCIADIYVADENGNDIGAAFTKASFDGDDFNDGIVYADWADRDGSGTIYVAIQFKDEDPNPLQYPNLIGTCSDTLFGNTLGNGAAVTSAELNDESYPEDLDYFNWNWVDAHSLFYTVNKPGQVEQYDANLAKLENPEENVFPGDPVEYTLTVSNDGTEDLDNVSIMDDFDETYLDESTINSETQQCLSNPGKVCFSLGSIAAGDEVVMTYTINVKEDVQGFHEDVRNDAVCSANHPLATPCEAFSLFDIGASPFPPEEYEANLTKSVSPKEVNPGDTVTYTLTLDNTGTGELTNMEVNDYYDTEHLESVTVTQGTECTSAEFADHVCFDVGTMSPGATLPVTLKYTAKVKDSTPNQTTVINDATCQSDQYPDPSGLYQTEPCHAEDTFLVKEGVQPQEDYELWVTEQVDKTVANPKDRLNYITSGGNKGPGDAQNVWFLTSLLIPNQDVVQQAFGELSPQPTVEELEELLQQKLNIVQPLSQIEQTQLEESGSLSGIGIIGQNETLGISGTSPDVRKYTNLPGDDYVTGLELPPSPVDQPQRILDIDRDGINDTIIHMEDANWAAGFSRAEDLYTNVRGSLNPGTYTIRNTGVVIDMPPNTDVTREPEEVLTDAVTTTVTVPGNVEPSPVLDVVKLVTDNDETNVTSNTAAAGETLTYTVSYTNTEQTGSFSAEGVTAREAWIVDDYDERYIEVTDTGGALDSGNALFWYLGDVGYGETVTKTFSARINSKLPGNGLDFINKAIAGALGVDPKEAIVDTTIPSQPLEPPEPYVVPRKDMLDVNGGVVEAGDVMQYRVVLENVGNAAAVEVEAKDILPATLQQLEVVEVSDGVIDQSTNDQLIMQVDRLEPQQKVEAVYQAKIIQEAQPDTEIINDIVVEQKDEEGTPGQASGTSTTGRVGSAFTGPSSGSAAAAQVAGAQTVETAAAETGGNTLVIAIVTAALALGAGIGVVYLRRQLIATPTK